MKKFEILSMLLSHANSDGEDATMIKKQLRAEIAKLREVIKEAVHHLAKKD